MIQRKKHTLLWFAAGLLFSLLVFLVVSDGLSGHVVVMDSEGIPEAADAVMGCIHVGDWKMLEGMVVGRPSLTPAIGNEGSAEQIIYSAYQQSLHWICTDDFSVQGPYVIQKVTVTCLDIGSVTKAMAEILANAAAASAAPENQAQMLYSAAVQVLEAEMPLMEREIALTFQREQGQWLLVPNSALQALLSGFTAH